ncbi:MAG: SLC13 family permease [Myxococcota bacterium]
MNVTQRIGLVLGPLAFLFLALAPMPEGLAGEGQRALAVMALCMTWWLTTPVAMPVTALLGMALLPVLGVLDKNEAVALFGNQAVFFIIAAFIVAAVFIRTGLSTRITLWLMRRLARSEDHLCAAVLLVAGGMTSVVVSHAVAALLLPIIVETVRAMELHPGSRFARRLLLSMAWGTICGSNLSLLSSGRAPLATGLYSSWHAGRGVDVTPIGFFEFTSGTAPIALLTLIGSFVILRAYHRPEGLDLTPAVRRLEEKAAALGPISPAETTSGVVVAVMVLALVVFGPTYGIGTVALCFAALLFLLQVISWEDAETTVNWGIVFLYGGAIAVATGLEKTRAVEFLVHAVLPDGVSPWLLVFFLAASAAFLTEFVSNAAVIALLLPLALTVAPEVGLGSRSMVFLLSSAAGLAFAFPMSTPAMAMVFGTGYLRPQDSAVPGLILTLIGSLVLLAVAMFVWPLFGIVAVEGP